MKITRIKPPKFRIGRYALNEYEIRQYCLEVAEGKRKPGDIIKDSEGNTATILRNGRLSNVLGGLVLSAQLTMDLLNLINKMREAQMNWETLGDIPVNEEGELDEDFSPKLRKGEVTFYVGDDCEEVWHWFEAHYNLSIGDDLMYDAFKW